MTFALGMMIGLFEVAFTTNQAGLFRNIDYARAIDAVRLVYLSSPRVRKWWSQTKIAYAENPEFVALIDKIAAEFESPVRKDEVG